MTHPILKRKIQLLGDYLEQLAPYVSLDVEILSRDNDKRLAMERVFQLVVDEAVDVNGVIAYQLGGKIPDSFKSSFYELVSLNIIENSFADRISESAKIRNELTHEYEKLTKIQVIDSIKKFNDMYKEYLKILVEKFIKS